MNLFQMHIMWYEAEMLNETFDSVLAALKFSKVETEVRLCINMQTYLEEPIDGTPEDMVAKFSNHPLMKKATVIYKTNKDPFYNIADWRRDAYNTNGYTFWGESDALVPEEYFYVVENLKINEPHYLSFSSRKMWEPSWAKIEHQSLKNKPYSKNGKSVDHPFNWDDYIKLEELTAFNRKQNSIQILKLKAPKIDGSLLVLSKGLPKFIPENMHFVEEDTCSQHSFEKHGIKQYLVANILKGHNYNHPLKRTNTKASRDDTLYKKYRDEARVSAKEFVDESFQKRRKYKWGYMDVHLQRKRNDILRLLKLPVMDFKQGSLVQTIDSPHK